MFCAKFYASVFKACVCKGHTLRKRDSTFPNPTCVAPTLKYLVFIRNIQETNSSFPQLKFFQNSWIRDPRYKHEYLDRVKIWVSNHQIEDAEESDKHLEARDRRYQCLKRHMLVMEKFTLKTFWEFHRIICEAWILVQTSFLYLCQFHSKSH